MLVKMKAMIKIITTNEHVLASRVASLSVFFWALCSSVQSQIPLVIESVSIGRISAHQTTSLGVVPLNLAPKNVIDK